MPNIKLPRFEKVSDSRKSSSSRLSVGMAVLMRGDDDDDDAVVVSETVVVVMFLVMFLPSSFVCFLRRESGMDKK